MKKKIPMTHEEHVELAKSLYAACIEVRSAHMVLGTKFGKTHPVVRKMRKLDAAFDAARSELDDAYHKVTSSAQFLEKGHVYYGGLK